MARCTMSLMIAVLRAIACDAMAHPVDATELLGVDVQQFAGRPTLITPHWLHGLQRLQGGQLQPPNVPTERGQAARTMLRNAPQWHGQTPLDLERHRLQRRACRRTVVRARAGDQQPGDPFGLEAGQPQSAPGHCSFSNHGRVNNVLKPHT